MIHLLMLLGSLGVAVGWRWRIQTQTRRWGQTLAAFVLPPVLVLTTALALVVMGPSGAMGGHWLGHLGHQLAWGLLVGAALLALRQGILGWWSGWQVRRQELAVLSGATGDPVRARILDSEGLFAAQVGGWDPQLVVTSGLLQRLTPEQLQAVLAHEEAHRLYRDTFWFLGLGWIRLCSSGLPQTGSLWQDLITLRELRADRWAAQRVDPLVLAESLLRVSGDGLLNQETPLATVGIVDPGPNQAERQRLSDRIEALLAEGCGTDPGSTAAGVESVGLWPWILPLISLPLLAIPFHF